MRVYPAIVPPMEIADRISAFSTSIADLTRGITGQRASGPHITLKAPQYPADFDAWLQSASRAVSQLSKFQVSFGAPTFVGRNVMALTLPVPQLSELNARLATALSKYNQPGITAYDYDLYAPHITLAYYGSLTQSQRVQLHDQAQSELLPLPGFTADTVAVFRRDDNDFKYRLSETIILS